MCPLIALSPRRKTGLNSSPQLVITLFRHQRTSLSVGTKTLHDTFNRRRQIHHKPAAQHIIHIVALTRRPPAASHHHIAHLPDFAEHSTLHPSELTLPVGSENLRDTTPEPLLDIEIQINKLPPQLTRQSTSESSLPARHISYNKNRCSHKKSVSPTKVQKTRRPSKENRRKPPSEAKSTRKAHAHPPPRSQLIINN